jgi:type II secretory ATPase GspE/PulE/Tfp pilus assembly ATPase PilB-like protein
LVRSVHTAVVPRRAANYSGVGQFAGRDAVPQSVGERFRQELAELEVGDPQYAVRVVDRLLAAGIDAGASDLHLAPTEAGLEMRWRIDGVLHFVGAVPAETAGHVVARLKVLAELLTYRTDIPQEGRIRAGSDRLERRLSTFPTLYGEKAVVRLFAAGQGLRTIDDLDFPAEVAAGLRSALAETSKAVLVTGPAGSGKTTTLYACLREVAAQSAGGRSLVSLEDPIEVVVAGVAQSQVNPAAGFDLATGLRSILRQDPEVIMVGEIRDRPTAETALQAALTGHLVLSSFHAGSAAEALSRLADMGMEPYLLRSGLRTIVGQRLVRRLCQCAREESGPDERLGLPVACARVALGCAACGGSGYRGRLVVAEHLAIEPHGVGRAILAQRDALHLEREAVAAGMVTLRQRACQAVEAGLTSPAEVRRVLGPAALEG